MKIFLMLLFSLALASSAGAEGKVAVRDTALVVPDLPFFRSFKYATGTLTAYVDEGDSADAKTHLRVEPDSVFVPSPGDSQLVYVPVWWVRWVDRALRQMGAPESSWHRKEKIQ